MSSIRPLTRNRFDASHGTAAEDSPLRRSAAPQLSVEEDDIDEFDDDDFDDEFDDDFEEDFDDDFDSGLDEDDAEESDDDESDFAPGEDDE
jgi:hypothetical protein